MEYFLMIASFTAIPLIVNQYLLPESNLLLLSPLQSTILPYLTIFAICLGVIVLINMSRALRTCPSDDTKWRSLGLTSGFELGLTSSSIAIALYIFISLNPRFKEFIIQFIRFVPQPYTSDVAGGLYLMIGGFVGYWFSRIFTTIC
jgi:hypothetical protein